MLVVNGDKGTPRYCFIFSDYHLICSVAGGGEKEYSEMYFKLISRASSWKFSALFARRRPSISLNNVQQFPHLLGFV